jgi:hypothetical protein
LAVHRSDVSATRCLGAVGETHGAGDGCGYASKMIDRRSTCQTGSVDEGGQPFHL